jgi:hypothetical protein
MSKLSPRDERIAEIQQLLHGYFGEHTHSIPIEFLWLLGQGVPNRLSLGRLNVILAVLRLLVEALQSSREHSNRLREIAEEERALS